ncbi:hypothetical protein ACO0K7_02780 [Undibacterium sp. Ji67W]|uniref:hypothetical protein n=1 Tax=Undibacterium sp. Ji67W TaxID=3413042 RepID=UPI003BF3531A
MITPTVRTATPTATATPPQFAEEIRHYDQVVANHIEMGLSLQQDYGTTCAIEYMQGKGVPNQITQQVLIRSLQHLQHI